MNDGDADARAVRAALARLRPADAEVLRLWAADPAADLATSAQQLRQAAQAATGSTGVATAPRWRRPTLVGAGLLGAAAAASAVVALTAFPR